MANQVTYTQGTDGMLQFAISIRVSMAELANWSPDRITAFFSGVAKALAANKGTVTEIPAPSLEQEYAPYK